jgi:hypothetical protein
VIAIAQVAWLFLSDKPAVTPRLAPADHGCAPPMLDAKERP